MKKKSNKNKSTKDQRDFDADWDENVRKVYKKHDVELVPKSVIVEKLDFFLGFFKKIDNKIQNLEKLTKISIWILILNTPALLFVAGVSLYFHLHPITLTP